jgi:hypothetical protein
MRNEPRGSTLHGSETAIVESQKEILVREIVEIEKAMYQALPADTPGVCRENEDELVARRRAQHLPWSERTLASYREDLRGACRRNVNLMAIKYARIDGQIPVYNHSPLIPAIVVILVGFQKSFLAAHPGIRQSPQPSADGSPSDDPFIRSFARSLSAELETGSETTLLSMLYDVQDKKNRGINIWEEINDALMRERGQAPAEGPPRGRGP